MEMDSRYHVGDKVRVICNNFRSEEVTSVRWCDLCGRYEYHTNNNLEALWSDEDFEFDIYTDLPEFDASSDNILDLFS